MALTSEQIIGILNETYESLGWAESGTNYITEDNISTIGVTSPNMRSTFIEQLKLCLESRFWVALFTPEKNSARNFIVDIGENGWGVLETYQNFLTANAPMWENSSEQIAQDIVTAVIPNVSRKYHDSPMSAQFKQTVNRRETDKLFTMRGVTEFINNTLAVLTTSAEYWLLTEFIKEIVKSINDNDVIVKEGFRFDTEEYVRQYAYTVRGIARDMELPSKLYNKDGILTSNEGSKSFYITDHITEEKINVLSNATAFNMDMADINSVEKIYIPSEIKPEKVVGILLDRRAIIIGMRTYTMRSFMVPNTLWENYWLSIEGIKSHSTFFNFVVFKEG